MNKPLVSIIIPNYNYAHYLPETIESALAQTYPNVEIIVVDDGSKDNSKEVLAGYGDKIKVIFQQNAGVAAARNHGFRESKGDFISFLDADDVWLPTKIEKQVKAFQKNINLGLVHVGVRDIDANGKNLTTHLEGLSGEVAKELLLFQKTVILGGGSGIMVARKVFEEVNGFDTRLSTSADWDFFYQLSSRYAVGFVNEILLNYRIHGSNMHGNIKRMESEMLIGFEKAFQNKNNQEIKKKAYAKLYQVLAGSYFGAGNYKDFLRTMFKSLSFSPANLGYFISFPIRKIKRF